MLGIPTPPEPPQGSEQSLHQLASYYRQLVGYHQNAAQTAARQLAHLEVLLGYNPPLSQDTISWLRESQIGEGTQERLEPSPSLPQLSPSLPAPGKLTGQIAALLATERGHAVHIGYIVRKLYGQPKQSHLDFLTAWVQLALESGAVQGKWSAVPDSPDCWTLDLQGLTVNEKNSIPIQTTLMTREVAQLLQMNSKTILKIKSHRGEQIQEGTHYLVDERNWLHWTELGIDTLRKLSGKPRKKREEL